MRARRRRACSNSSRTSKPAPSPATNPSRSLSNGREAFSRASLRSLSARAEGKPRVLQRHLRRGEAELDEEVVAARFLAVHVEIGVELLHLSRDAGGQVLGVEARDGADAALAGDGRLPRRLGPDAQGRDQAETCDDDSALNPLHFSDTSPLSSES